MQKVEKDFIKRSPDIRPGDTVKVHLRITEGGKERIQVFEGIVIAMSGTGLGKSITVRKISSGIGVERIFPLNASVIKKIDVTDRGDVRRAKLFYMRKAVGKRSLDVGYSEGFEGIEELEVVSKEEGKVKDDSIEIEDSANGGEVDKEGATDVKEEIVELAQKEEKKVEDKKKTEGPAGTAPSDEASPAEAASVDGEKKDTDKKDTSVE